MRYYPNIYSHVHRQCTLLPHISRRNCSHKQQRNPCPALPTLTPLTTSPILASSILAPIIFNSYEISGFTEHPQTLFDECQAARKRD